MTARSRVGLKPGTRIEGCLERAATAQARDAPSIHQCVGLRVAVMLVAAILLQDVKAVPGYDAQSWPKINSRQPV